MSHGAQPESLERQKQLLMDAESVLDRQRRVFCPSALVSHFELPADFFFF